MSSWEEQSLYDRFCTTRQGQMAEDKSSFLPVIEEIIEYLRPDLTGNTDSDTGKQMGSSIVEGTAHFDAAIMSRWFVGNLVGPELDWVRYRMAQRKYKGDDVFNAWLQRLAEFMLEDVYSYPYSNFYEVNNHFVLDGITIGSPIMLMDEDRQNRRKVCTIPHYTENFLMRDWFGSDVAYHRNWQVTNFAAMQAFGKDNLPLSIRNEINNGNYNIKHSYLMCIARAGDKIFSYDTKNFPHAKKHQIPLLRPWMQLWFSLSATTEDEMKPLNYAFVKSSVDGQTVADRLLPTSSPGFWHKPFNSWHYNRLPHETYSRTPAWSSLPDVKGLNVAWRTVHEVAHAAARPATTALESLKGRLKLGAEGITWVSPEELAVNPIRAYENKANYNWSMDFIDRRTKCVGRHFFADMARMIENYSRDHKQPPTAYQLSQMISETLTLVGPAITSYAGPALAGIDEQFLEIESRPMRRGDVTSSRMWQETQPPDEILETSGDIMPVFTGPLIQGLRYAMLAKRIQQPLMMAAPILDYWPETRNKIRAADLLEDVLEGGNFPQADIVGKEEYAAIIQSLQAERRQQKMLENVSMMAESVPKLQAESEEKSPLRTISEAM